jgi:dimethylglycine dehydrogenase
VQSYRVVVIGGGITGTSVLYHLAAKGWTDIARIERHRSLDGRVKLARGWRLPRHQQ